jgi:phenylacetate-coenzyme A ligase PaaK-like adenylate-forming protein
MEFEELKNRIFTINSDTDFNGIALEIFHFQYARNPVYHQYVDLNHTKIADIDHFKKIPFLPIEFYKSHKISSSSVTHEKIFRSSGTSGSSASKHFIADLSLYERSFLTAFNQFYGNPRHYIILALLPSYPERNDSSLIYMVEYLIRCSKNAASGFYLENYDELVTILNQSFDNKILLLGVAYALLDLVERFEVPKINGIIMETGGMKGRRKEIVREELHALLKSKFNVSEIHSEYGMTELLSQAYSPGNGIFKTPPWMKILIRDTNDPKTLLEDPKSGGINVIDLANLYSCSFIATQDLGIKYSDGSFEVIGRFDNSDIRGCNLMIG